MTPPRRRWRAAGSLVLASCLAWSLTWAAAAARAGDRPMGDQDAYHFVRSTRPVAPAPVVWHPCFDGLDCALVGVPLDHADRYSPLIAVSVVRHRADDAAARLGVLFVNPGGPGGSASQLVRDIARRPRGLLPEAITSRFDIVGVDPRGTVNSTPVRCGGTTSAATPTTIPSSMQVIRQLALKCGRSSGALLDHIDSLSSAADLDWVRQALGERQVSYLGFSYGGYLGALYADRYPSTLRSVVLDSGLDDSPFGTGLLTDKARAWDRTLRAFFGACADGSLSPCPFAADGESAADLAAAYRAIISRYPDPATLRRPDQAPEGRFDADVLALLEDRERGWPELASGLALARRGGDPGASLDTTVLGRLNDANAIIEAFLAYSCRDGQYTRDPARLAGLPPSLRTSAPLFPAAALALAEVAVCRYWPVPALHLPPITSIAGPPVLVIGSTLDIAAPVEWQQSLAVRTGGTLLLRTGPGHGAITLSTCIADAAARFLADLEAPGPRTVCPS